MYIFFSFLYHAENYQNKTFFRIFYKLLSLMTRWYAGNDNRTYTNIRLLSFKNYEHNPRGDPRLMFNLVTPWWWSHKHNNNSNILEMYFELKFIGVFIFSLWFPAVFLSHIYILIYRYNLDENVQAGKMKNCLTVDTHLLCMIVSITGKAIHFTI